MFATTHSIYLKVNVLYKVSGEGNGWMDIGPWL